MFEFSVCFNWLVVVFVVVIDLIVGFGLLVRLCSVCLT